MSNQKSFLDNFILVEYNNLSYPEGYTAQIQEVAAHFDKEYISPKGAYSLHTEYSYSKRKFNTTRISEYPALVAAHKDGVPQLWKSNEWAAEFADFIIGLTADQQPPTVIEIHPPFNDYCTLEEFAERFRIFEEKIHNVYPDATLVIENRAGSVYHGGRFLVGKAKEIVSLCELIKGKKIKLGIVLDFPQLLTAESINPYKFKVDKYETAIATLAPHKDLIRGIHIWGKRKNDSGRQLAHQGNFDTYFGSNDTVKAIFLSGIHQICNDGVSRFLVPEVNSNAEDLKSIIQDLECVQA